MLGFFIRKCRWLEFAVRMGQAFLFLDCLSVCHAAANGSVKISENRKTARIDIKTIETPSDQLVLCVSQKYNVKIGKVYIRHNER